MSTFKTRFSQLRAWLAYLKEMCFGPYINLELRPESEQKAFRYQAYVMAGLYGSIVISLTSAIFEVVLGLAPSLFFVWALVICWALLRMKLPGYVPMTAWVRDGSNQEIGYGTYALRPFKATWLLISLYVKFLLVAISLMVLFDGYRPARGQSWRDTIIEMNPFVFQMAFLMIVGLAILRVLRLCEKALREMASSSQPDLSITCS